MKILYCYRHGILGGVCTQLYHRFRGHVDEQLEIHCLFNKDHGVAEMLGEFATIHFGIRGEDMAEFVIEQEFDAIVVIDSPEYFKMLKEVEHGSKVFLEVHTSIFKNLEYLRQIERADIDGIITVSEYMIEIIQERLSEECSQLSINKFSNVLDTDLFNLETSRERKSKVPLLWIGKIDDHKDWKTFFKICQALNSNSKDREFWLVGGQTCAPKLAQEVFDKALELGILSQLHWIDRIENENMSRIYSYVAKNGGCKLITSHNESFGMSALESMLSGCPVISSRVGALPEISETGAHFMLYELQNVDEATKLIIQMNSDKGMHEANDALIQVNSKLVEEFSSNKRSIDYWNMMKVMVG